MKRYQLLRAIGRGSHAQVAAALDTETGVEVAIKFLRSSEPEDLARFQREADILRSLDHPGIVKVLDAGADGDQPYIVMERLRGMNLEQLRSKKELSVRQTLGIARKVARALDYAHARGVIHRDVKPANVFITTERVVKLTDFGIARFLEKGHSLTEDGVFLGTHEFIAPEVARGGKAEAAADLYALGAMTYLMLAGAPPFPGESAMQSLIARTESDPPRLSSLAPVSPDVDALVMECLARDPGARPTVADFANRAQRLLINTTG